MFLSGLSGNFIFPAALSERTFLINFFNACNKLGFFLFAMAIGLNKDTKISIQTLCRFFPLKLLKVN